MCAAVLAVAVVDVGAFVRDALRSGPNAGNQLVDGRGRAETVSNWYLRAVVGDRCRQCLAHCDVVGSVAVCRLLEKGLAMYDVLLRVELVSDDGDDDPGQVTWLEHPFKMAIPPAVGMDIELPGDPGKLADWSDWRALVARVCITRTGEVVVYVAEDLSGNEVITLLQFKESVEDLVAAGWKVYA